jgi:hypothetical protein
MAKQKIESADDIFLLSALSNKPVPFDCEHIVDSGVGRLITREK